MAEGNSVGQPQCHVLSTRRIFPANPPKLTTVTRLSIADASVARFAPCGAIWLYDRTTAVDARDPVVFERLEKALRLTLDGYRHYAGQLQWAENEQVAGGVSNLHLGRPIVVYGAAGDPGVELLIAEDDRELCSIVPSREERATAKKLWNATDFPQYQLLPNTKLAFASLAEFQGLPGAAVQLTAFKCGGYAVGVKLTHCLSDALCLLHFVHSWAARSQALFRGDDNHTAHVGINHAEPHFDPSVLDRYAGLSAVEPELDTEKIDKARCLPMHRFDWWATDAPGYPSWATVSSNATKPSAEELPNLQLSPSTFPPWLTWNLAAPVEHVQIRFKAEELARMKKAAEESLPVALKGQRISRLDAALAHVWILINRARQLQNSQDPVYMDITLGMRNRVDPPLSENFVGSPILLAYVEKTGAQASAAQIGVVASSIREMMSRFTPDAVSAYLYDVAHEVSPQRLWQAFLGSQHTLVTSWVRARAYEVDFGATQELARYVQGVMPRMDGLVQVIDIADTGDFDISVCLEKETLHRLTDDPLLRAFEGLS